MTKKILIIGSGSEGKTELMLRSMKEKHGEDIILVTPDEANEQGLKMEDFDNLTKMKLTATLLFNEIQQSGKEKRRERRKLNK